MMEIAFMAQMLGVKSAVFNSIWVGNKLLPLTNSCINSFKDHGHQFHLFTYNFIENVPDFVEQRNADEIVSKTRVFHAHDGWETFADEFRYQFLNQVGGWWVDCDVVCNMDDLPDVEIAFAEERGGVINNAVLKFPRGHNAISNLIEYIATVDPINSIWGSIGPLALTKVLNQLDLENYKRDMSEFYPLQWRESPKLLFPEFTDEVFKKIEKSPFIHLWAATLRELDFDLANWSPIAGSYLDILYEKYLDPHIRARLRPFDEAEYRRSVREYVNVTPHWRIDLAI